MAATVAADVKSNKSEVRFQKLKAEIHKRIVETLDLTRLPAWTEDRLRQEVRALAKTHKDG